MKIILSAVMALALSAAGASLAQTPAQAGMMGQALSAATIGEQADGFLGVRGEVSGDVRAGVDALNIKRRQAYADLAAQRGVTVKDVAAAVGCTTLKTRVGPGQAYLLRDGVWRVRQGATPIPLPDYCG